MEKVPLPDLVRLFEGLRAPLGTYAVLGNHDWWDDRDAMQARRGPVESRRLLEARGIPVLENDALRLTKDRHPFWLAGLADQEPFLPMATGAASPTSRQPWRRSPTTRPSC